MVTDNFELKRTAPADGDGHGSDTEYEQLLIDLKNRGVIQDGTKFNDNPILAAIPGRQSTLSMMVSVPNASEAFKDKADALLVDLLARTSFVDRKERLYYLDWVDWCKEFGVPLDNCIRYLVSARSENGEAVEQAIRAMTNITHRQYNYGDGKQLKEKSRKGGIT